MFQDEDYEPVSFGSSWKTKRSVQDGACQTSEILANEAETQATYKQDVMIQTEKEDEKKAVAAVEEEDSPELLEFLRRIYPALMAELDANTRSHAFDGYQVDWEDSTDSVHCLHTLTHSFEEKLEVTCISWNPTGAVIAVAYGRYDHQDWCTHKSSVCTWNLDRRSFDPNKPDAVIDISTCVMCIAFHPVLPSLILVGTFNGAVFVYDIANENDPLIGSSGVGENTHKDPVSQVTWFSDPTSKDKKFRVISAGADGKILIWRLSQSSKSLKLLRAYVFQTDNIPRNFRVSKARDDSMVGVTCLSFSHEDQTTFIAGSEGGGVFKCSTNSIAPASSDDMNSIPVHSPVTLAYYPYLGPVHSVSCSQHHRNVFLAAGADTIRLYNMLQLTPSLTIEPSRDYLYSIRWSCTRSVVFAVTCAKGKILLYDLKENRINPVLTLIGCSKESSVYTAEFNPSRKHLLATGNGVGEVKIWKLSDELVTPKPRDQDVLESLAILYGD
ncbi:cytoplasmic dynein 2 intermediate chain 2-like [Xenia sp. Carnegie-2017]|uniref:cytoplasmic dynein 2 intermediate chain 2-like n=1 Tax=Xenia sp. Carnegie-2017 TaxID=2897299 RepID=UPI001F044B08|nr:cytoplasmic dynein 2 intermediate chain 2-like [Xenia sp. Carnegie-2017]